MRKKHIFPEKKTNLDAIPTLSPSQYRAYSPTNLLENNTFHAQSTQYFQKYLSERDLVTYFGKK